MSVQAQQLCLDGRTVLLRPARVEEILPLRDNVLILGTERTDPHFEGDTAATTWHFGAFAPPEAPEPTEMSGATTRAAEAGGDAGPPADACVACVSFMLSEHEGEPAWQLRGMATRRAFRSRGIGAALLEYAERILWGHREVRLIWCNARIGAAEFYLTHGFRKISDEFSIDGVGPHFQMLRRMEQPKAAGRADPSGGA